MNDVFVNNFTHVSGLALRCLLQKTYIMILASKFQAQVRTFIALLIDGPKISTRPRNAVSLKNGIVKSLFSVLSEAKKELLTSKCALILHTSEREKLSSFITIKV